MATCRPRKQIDVQIERGTSRTLVPLLPILSTSVSIDRLLVARSDEDIKHGRVTSQEGSDRILLPLHRQVGQRAQERTAFCALQGPLWVRCQKARNPIYL